MLRASSPAARLSLWRTGKKRKRIFKHLVEMFCANGSLVSVIETTADMLALNRAARNVFLHHIFLFFCSSGPFCVVCVCLCLCPCTHSDRTKLCRCVGRCLFAKAIHLFVFLYFLCFISSAFFFVWLQSSSFLVGRCSSLRIIDSRVDDAKTQR